ncbi:MAG: J domain-containing protein [Thermodesulfobacteriota bacterium]
MAKIDSYSFGSDPRVILGVSEDAEKADIRRAYLKKIKAYPPDRHPEMFEKIRDAYELLLDPRKRMAFFLRSIDPEAPFVSLLEGAGQKRQRVGPEPWLSLMKRDR